MDRESMVFNKFIWKTYDDEFIFLDEIFKYWDSWSTWLTYSSFTFHTEMQKDKDDDDYLYSSEWEYLFTEYIKRSHDYNTSMEEWIDMCKDEHPNWVAYDDSDCWEQWLLDVMKQYSEETWYDYEYSNCVWWWRMWKDSPLANRDTYEFVNEEFWPEFQKLLDEYEK